MGWCSGTEVAQKWFAQIRKYVPPAKQQAAAFEMIDALRNQDWDCEGDLAAQDRKFATVYDAYRAAHGESDD